MNLLSIILRALCILALLQFLSCIHTVAIQKLYEFNAFNPAAFANSKIVVCTSKNIKAEIHPKVFTNLFPSIDSFQIFINNIISNRLDSLIRNSEIISCNKPMAAGILNGSYFSNYDSNLSVSEGDYILIIKMISISGTNASSSSASFFPSGGFGSSPHLHGNTSPSFIITNIYAEFWDLKNKNKLFDVISTSQQEDQLFVVRKVYKQCIIESCLKLANYTAGF